MAEEYQNLTDEQLIERLRGGDERVMDYILDKYKPLVLGKANAMFLIGGDTDDLIQEGMIGLFKAIRDFRDDRASTFFHFAELCIARQLYSAEFWEELKGRLSPMEREVLDAYLSGQNYRQIADEMGKSPKAIDNALSRIKAKIK